eukprot:CAMPEP_0115258770 /NCGR_PEP_ID=MMETSP0270-20121206/47472_1 /TAXON_ID=71861 /ORGANISM="Scrippsiella trochoidea, Strain CCMP3099" /LENGTH=59 /DNA_ID=CAMNT_0002674543 /DNA_START=330 /DNA_END=507 /DNA_ORIENTATION=-
MAAVFGPGGGKQQFPSEKSSIHLGKVVEPAPPLGSSSCPSPASRAQLAGGNGSGEIRAR